MAKQQEDGTGADTDDVVDTRPAPGATKRYPVQQPDGSVRHQLILIVPSLEGDDEGTVRGVNLGYEERDTGQFRPEHFAD